MKARLSFLMVFLLAVSMFLAACTTGGDKADEGKKTDTDKDKEQTETNDNGEDAEQILRLAELSEIPSMDHTLSTDTVAFTVLNQVMEGLYRLDDKNQPTKGMAEDVEISEDGKTYTFKLRDAKWSNGTPVTANDFVFSWQRAVNPETASQYSFIMGPIKNAEKIIAGELPVEELGVKAEDDKTLVVELENPTGYFLSLTSFATYYPLNQEYFESVGDEYALEYDTMIYNGPFKMTGWEHEVGWTVEKNEDYWDANTVKLDAIEWKVVKENATEVNLYETGELDRVILAGDFVSKYKDHEDFMAYGEPVVFWFKFNHTDPVLGNENIRRALAMGFDKSGVTDVILNNGSKPIGTFMPWDFVKHPDTGEDFNEKYGDILNYDLEKAQEYWQKGLDELGKSEVELEILGGDDDTYAQMLEYYKNQFEKNLPGLTIKLKPVPFKQRLELDKEMDYQLQIAGWGPDYLDALTFADLWVTDGGHNKMGYSNPEFDELIEEARTTLANDPAARFEAMQEAVRIALEEDAALAPIYQRGRSILLEDKVKGVLIHPFGPDFSFKWTSIEE